MKPISWHSDSFLEWLEEYLSRRGREIRDYWKAGLAHLGFLQLWYIYEEKDYGPHKWTRSFYPPPSFAHPNYTLAEDLAKIKRYGLANPEAFAALHAAYPDNPYRPWSWLLAWFKVFSSKKHNHLLKRGYGRCIEDHQKLMDQFLRDLLALGAFPPPGQVLCYYVLSQLAVLRGDLTHAKQLIIEHIPLDPCLPSEVLNRCLSSLQTLSHPFCQSNEQLLKVRPLWGEFKDTKPESTLALTSPAQSPLHALITYLIAADSSAENKPPLSTEMAQFHLSVLLKALAFFGVLTQFQSDEQLLVTVSGDRSLDPTPVMQFFEPRAPELLAPDADPVRWNIYRTVLPPALEAFSQAQERLQHHIQQALLYPPLNTGLISLYNDFLTRFTCAHLPAFLSLNAKAIKRQSPLWQRDLLIVGQIVPALLTCFYQAIQLVDKQQGLIKQRLAPTSFRQQSSHH